MTFGRFKRPPYDTFYPSEHIAPQVKERVRRGDASDHGVKTTRPIHCTGERGPSILYHSINNHRNHEPSLLFTMTWVGSQLGGNTCWAFFHRPLVVKTHQAEFLRPSSAWFPVLWRQKTDAGIWNSAWCVLTIGVFKPEKSWVWQCFFWVPVSTMCHKQPQKLECILWPFSADFYPAFVPKEGWDSLVHHFTVARVFQTSQQDGLWNEILAISQV